VWCRTGAPLLAGLALVVLVVADGVAPLAGPRRGTAAAEWERMLRKRGAPAGAIEDPFATTAEMREAARQMAGRGGAIQQLRSLQSSLMDVDRFAFDYRSRETVSARTAFERRAGNCVSFTSLFIALGRSLGHPVDAALIRRHWRTEMTEQLEVVNNHMVAMIPVGPDAMVFDFDRSRREPTHPLQPIDDLWVAAIHVNNLGVERLRRDDPLGAVERVGLATRLAPDYVEAWGNLGVALRRAGRTEAALAAYRRGLEIEAGHPGVLCNLAVLLRDIGREQEAEQALAAARLRDASPLGLIVLGNLERDRGRLRKALRLYRRARYLDPRSPEPWVAIARVRASVGKGGRARRALREALRRDPEHPVAIAMLQALDTRE
jgi:Tfp pilus assembly protein PilF